MELQSRRSVKSKMNAFMHRQKEPARREASPRALLR